ncbi:hypothetical protein LTS09_016230 [Friedmanniomyces endolithicus]|nr:hypothetical protein LTS09_016230 [Friedmanniomyces endolithicus]
MHLTQLRAEARKLTVPPPPSRTPTLVTPPREGYLFHLEGQSLVAAFDRACVEGGCSRGERAALYQRCVLKGGLREVVEAQEAKEVARRVEFPSAGGAMAGAESVGKTWEGSAGGATTGLWHAALVDSYMRTVAGPWEGPVPEPWDATSTGVVLDAPITGVKLDGPTVGVMIEWPMAGVAFDGARTEMVVAQAPPPQTARVSYADMARRAA